MITTGLFFLLNEFFIYNYYDNNLINGIFHERITCSIIVILSRKGLQDVKNELIVAFCRF